MSSVKITCVIVCYNGGEALAQSLPKTLLQVDDVLIVDNNSDLSTKHMLKKLESYYPERVHLIFNESNLWFGKAANIGIKEAIDRGADYILQLNDDNYLSDGSVRSMLKHFFLLTDKPVAIVAPTVVSGPMGFDVSKRQNKDEPLIASAGMLVPAQIFHDIGFYDDQLLIGYEDYDFSLRAVERGYRCLSVGEALLHAKLGGMAVQKFLWKKIMIFHYSPLRRYYAARNGLVLLWRHKNMRLTKFVIWWELNSIIGVLFFEKNKFEKLLLTCRGYFDAFRNKLGHFE